MKKEIQEKAKTLKTEALKKAETLRKTEALKKAEVLKKAETLKKAAAGINAEPEGIFPEEYQMIPMDKIGKFRIRPGIYELEGATALPSAVNFTVQTKEGTSVELLLFRNKEMEPFAVLPFPKSYRIGSVWSMIVFGLDIETFEYAYRVDGPYDPQKGLLFDKNRILLDPYARAVTGQSVWGSLNGTGTFYKSRVVRNNFDWGKEPIPLTPMEDLVIYELHVRGFTKDPSSGVAHPGTFDGLREKIPYLKELGVNAVELMPVFEFDEMQGAREVDGKQVVDYWGYNTLNFFSPNTSYAADVEYNREGRELKELIRELNDNGICCFLDVVFNHTAEGNEDGPFISFKGFDNQIWYMLTPDGRYYNFSGCGNTVNCNHPVVQQMIVDCLRYWATAYHVDGFRFDLASILGRSQTGEPLASPPLLERLAGDPLLSNVKLIAEAWDAGGLYQVGTFPAWKRWAEWNGRYRDDLRDYLKGNLDLAGVAALRMTGSPDLYDPAIRGDNASVNFLNCHDGFTLWDMYSYNEKHNLANGWENTDGANDNRSWNCGAEGPTKVPSILTLRKRLCMNAAAVLMMSRGTPMFFAGDEFLNSQQGNNNAYCQDNEISWLNWDDLKKNREHFEFTKFMIAFRKAHDVIRKNCGDGAFGLPPVLVMKPGNADEDGSPRTGSNILCLIYSGEKETPGKKDARGPGEEAVGIAVNVFWEPQEVTLPELPEGMVWRAAADTFGTLIPDKCAADGAYPEIPDRKLTLGPRSVVVFAASS